MIIKTDIKVSGCTVHLEIEEDHSRRDVSCEYHQAQQARKDLEAVISAGLMAMGIELVRKP